MHFDRWPGQTTGREVEAVVTPNDGGLGPVTHSFPPSHQGGRGTIKRSNHHRVNHPPKEVGDAKTEDSHRLCPLVAVCRGRVFDRLHSASVAIKPSQPRKTPNLHGATEPSTFGNWMIHVRANRARRKTGLCEDYKCCCAYALDSLQSLFIDNQEAAAQIHKYPGSTYSPADKC